MVLRKKNVNLPPTVKGTCSETTEYPSVAVQM